jgi:hypothetical protein
MLQCTIDTETMSVLKVKAAMNRMTVGRFLDSLIHSTYSRDKIVEEWAAGTPPEPKRSISTPKPLAKAPRSRQEEGKVPTSDEGTRAELWQVLEARREAEGWDDGDIAQPLGIATRNVSQWRKAGMVTSTQVEAVTKLLNQPKGNLPRA